MKSRLWILREKRLKSIVLRQTGTDFLTVRQYGPTRRKILRTRSELTCRRTQKAEQHKAEKHKEEQHKEEQHKTGKHKADVFGSERAQNRQIQWEPCPTEITSSKKLRERITGAEKCFPTASLSTRINR